VMKEADAFPTWNYECACGEINEIDDGEWDFVKDNRTAQEATIECDCGGFTKVTRDAQ